MSFWETANDLYEIANNLVVNVAYHTSKNLINTFDDMERKGVITKEQKEEMINKKGLREKHEYFKEKKNNR
jgi:hypothetical protein